MHHRSTAGTCAQTTESSPPLLVWPIAAAAAGYMYDLVRVDNPSVPVLDTATGNGPGYTFVKTGEPTPTDTTTDPNTYSSTTNTFYIRGTFLTDGLYLVRVRSHNPLNDAGVASSWSDLIGTGDSPVVAVGASWDHHGRLFRRVARSHIMQIVLFGTWKLLPCDAWL